MTVWSSRLIDYFGYRLLPCNRNNKVSNYMKEHDISRGGGDGSTWEDPVDKVLIQPKTVRVKFHCTFSFCNNEHKLYLLLHCCKRVIQLSTFIQSNIYIRDWNLPSGLKRASVSHSAIVGPVRTYLFLYENGDLFSPFWPTVLLSGGKRSPKMHLFKNALESGDFWKRSFTSIVGMGETWEGFWKRLRHGLRYQ